ncbi:MAG: c-type cytochrome domain-containing protein [Verrucomicrobiota bacterium]
MIPRWRFLGLRMLPCLAGLASPLWSQVPIPAAELAKLPPPLTRPVDFQTEVDPIFKAACFKCHGAEKQKGKYRMDTREGAFKRTGDHGPAIQAGKSAQSAIILMAAGLIDEMLMPPPGGKPGESDPLTREQISLLRGWIDQGANWPDGPIAEVVAPVRFDPDIRKLLSEACARCHSGASAEGGFSMESLERVLAGGKSYGKVVTPGDPKKSSLLTILAGKDEDIPKPESHRIADKGLKQVEEWIRQGAK